jgi:hypothetical protein
MSWTSDDRRAVTHEMRLLRETLGLSLVSANELDSNSEAANMVDGLYTVARALQWLGNADASTPMGALEAHGAAMLESSEKIASGLHDIAEAIREKG